MLLGYTEILLMGVRLKLMRVTSFESISLGFGSLGIEQLMGQFLQIWFMLILVTVYVLIPSALRLLVSGIIPVTLLLVILVTSYFKPPMASEYYWWWHNEVQEGEETQVGEVEDSV
jgi:membrane protein implicated in regulation of membrane protease activity